MTRDMIAKELRKMAEMVEQVPDLPASDMKLKDAIEILNDRVDGYISLKLDWSKYSSDHQELFFHIYFDPGDRMHRSFKAKTLRGVVQQLLDSLTQDGQVLQLANAALDSTTEPQF